MNEIQFLRKVRKGIHFLPAERQTEIMEDLKRHFADGREAGHDDEQLTRMLGTPDDLIRDYMQQESGRGISRSVGGKIGASIGMFFFDLCIALPVFLSVWAVCGLALPICGVAFGLSGGLALIYTFVGLAMPLYLTQYFFLYLFTSLFIASAGVLLSIASWSVIKKLSMATLRFFHWNRRIITKKGAEQ